MPPAPGTRLFSCPRCGTVTRDRAAAENLYCPACQAYTGLCGAGRRLRFIAGILPSAGAADWRHFCPRPGDGGYWLVISADNLAAVGSGTDTVLCGSHRDALLQMRGAGWIHARPLQPAPPRPGGLARLFCSLLPGAPARQMTRNVGGRE